MNTVGPHKTARLTPNRTSLGVKLGFAVAELTIAEFDEDRDIETFVGLHRQIYPEQAISVQGFRDAAPVRRGRFWVMVIGRRSDRAVGFARAMTNPFDATSIDVMLGVEPELRGRGYGSTLTDAIAARIANRTERYVEVVLSEGDTIGRAIAEKRGLRLHATRVRLEGETGQIVASTVVPKDYRIERIKDWRNAYSVYCSTLTDNPDRMSPPSYKLFRHLTVESDEFLDDSNLGAFAKGQLVGITLFERYGPAGGRVVYTGVLRRHRHQGLAKALKARSIFEALRRGVTSVITYVNAANGPMLSANESLGFKRVGGHWWMRMERRD